MPPQILYSKKSSLLLVTVLGLAALQLSARPNSLPQAVVSARTIFLENETGFPELQYTAILELNKWGHFDYAETREKSDLVLRLDAGTKVHAVPEGQMPGTQSFGDTSAIPRGHTRIALVDPKTSTTLWSDVHKTEGGKVKNGHLLDGLREAFEEYDKTRSHS
jgi:hypothetical protein